MAFEQFEESARHGGAIRLFRFSSFIGSVDRPVPDICYADAERPIFLGLERFEPLSIRHGGITYSGSMDKLSVDVILPKTTKIYELFKIYPPSYVVTLTIYRGHEEDETHEFIPIWSGRVLSAVSSGGMEATLSCELATTSLMRPGLRRNYQHQCPLVLYGPICKAEKIARFLTVLDHPTVNTILAEEQGSLDAEDNEFLGGTVEWTTAEGHPEIRNIFGIARSEDRLVLAVSGPTASVVTDSTISIFLGCDHVMEVCQDRFDNIANFGGQPWIPFENPIGKVSTFF